MTQIDLNASWPPAHFSAPQQALWWLKKGELSVGRDWQSAHALCQQQEGDKAHDLIHALCHWIEGDIANRDYWYRRVGEWHRSADISQEWDAIWRALNNPVGLE